MLNLESGDCKMWRGLEDEESQNNGNSCDGNGDSRTFITDFVETSTETSTESSTAVVK